MSHLKNLQRDMLWPRALSPLSEGTGFAFGAASVVVATSNLLFDTDGFMQSVRGDLSAGGDFCAFGLSIKQPLGETTPYRMKGYSTANCVYGYGFASAVAASISVSSPVIFAAGSSVDEIVAVPFNDASPDNVLVVFAMASTDETDFLSCLSVQRLLGQPRQYASGVS